jgi:hypothetical protein
MMRNRERGNVFTILLGGVALTGVLGYMMYQTMAGPVASMTRVTKTAATQAQMMSLAKSVLVDAVNQSTTYGGDCDIDGFIEPRQFTSAAAGVAPSGGGLLPSTLAASVKDPWNSTYGYCVWDVGTSNDPAVVGTDTANCPAGANRLKGSPDPSATANGTVKTQTVFAVISAGPDRRFSTVCSAYNSVTKADLIAPGGDDVILRYTYKEAEIIANGLWTLKTGTPTTATILKNLDVTSTGAGTTGGSVTSALGMATAVNTGGASATIGKITASSGVQLGDQNKVANSTCSPGSNDGMLRYNTGSGTAITVKQALTTVSLARTTSTSSASSFAVTVSNNNTIIVTIAGKATGGAFAMTPPTDDKGNTYNLVTSKTGVVGSNAGAFIYAAYNVTNAPRTVTVNFSGGTNRSLSWGAMEVTGLVQNATQANVLDRTDTAGQVPAVSTTQVVPAAAAQATTQATEFAVAVHGYDDSTGDINIGYASAVQPGWTQVFSNDDAYDTMGFSTVYTVLNASGASVQHTWTLTAPHAHATGDYTVMAIASFKAQTPGSGSGILQYCVASTSTWTTAGGGSSSSGGTTPAVQKIADLYDGKAGDYASTFHVGLGENVLASINGSSAQATAIGMSALTSLTSGVRDTAMGHMAGYGLLSGADNALFGSNTSGGSAAGASTATGFGAMALAVNGGAGNTGFGYQALSAVAAGANNTAFGSQAGATGAGQSGDTAFGYRALKADTGGGNTAFGYTALTANTSGAQNTAFGAAALAANTVAAGNTAFGNNAMAGTTGARGTAIGYYALSAAGAGTDNTAAGYRSLAANTASGNTAAGSYALTANTTGAANTAAGYQALLSNTTGSNNTAAGHGALAMNTLGSNNTAAGYQALAANNRQGTISVLQTSSIAGKPCCNMGDVDTASSSFSTLPVAGNTIVVMVSSGLSSGATAVAAADVTDNQGGTYTLAYSQSTSNSHARAYVFYRSNISAPSGTFTISINKATGGLVWSAIEVAGLANSSPVDLTQVSNDASASGSFTISSAASAAQPNELLLSVLAYGDGSDNNNVATFSPRWITDSESDWISQGRGGGGGAHAVITEGGQPSMTWKVNNNLSSGVGILVSFKGVSSISVAQAPWTASPAATSISTSFPTLPVAGDTVIAVVAARQPGSLTLSDNQGGTYTQAVAGQHCGNNMWEYIYYRSNIAAPSGTYTLTLASSSAAQLALGSMDVAGLAAANVLDATGSATSAQNATSTAVSTSGATAQADELAVTGFGQCGTGGMISVAGATLDINSAASPAAGSAHAILNSTGVKSYTWTHPAAAAGTSGAVVATFKSSGAATPTGGDYGNDNTAIGAFALNANTGGDGNTAYGASALYNNNGAGNTAVGDSVLYNLTTGNYNTALRPENGGTDMRMTTGSYNTVAGNNALGNVTTGNGSTGIGTNALRYSTGAANTAFGDSAMAGTYTTGSYNVGLGQDELLSLVTGDGNTGLETREGMLELRYGSYNTAFLGMGQLRSGDGNTGIGYDSALQTGSYNTYAGADATMSAVDGRFNTVIGNRSLYNCPDDPSGSGQAFCHADGQTALGVDSLKGSGSGTVAVGDGLIGMAYGVNNTAIGADGGCCSGGTINLLDYSHDNAAVGVWALATFPFQTVTGAVTNAGLVKLTVGSTSDFPTGTIVTVQGVRGVPNVNGVWTVTNNTATTITLQGSVFSGTYNDCTGSCRGLVGIVGNNNTAGGYQTGYQGNNGSTAVGSSAMWMNADWSTNSTLIGYGAGASSARLSNDTVIGYFATPNDSAITASNMIGIGDIAANITFSTIGGQVAFTATSDRRFKKGIADSDLGLGFIEALRPVSYRMKKGDGRLDYGFVAQEVQRALGARQANMALPPSGKNKYWMLRGDDLIAPLVKAIQERQTDIDRQQADIDDLKAQIDAAERAVDQMSLKH